MSNVLIASVVHQHPMVFDGFLQLLRAQHTPGIRISYYFRFDETDVHYADNMALALSTFPDAKCVMTHKKQEQEQYAVEEETHKWNRSTFSWLGRERQEVLEEAKRQNVDAVWLLDSDLMCDTRTLWSMWKAQRPITSAVFWTQWDAQTPPLPNVWASHPYEFQGNGYEAHEFLRNAAQRQLFRVGGLGACTLIRRETFGKVAYYPPLEGLPEGGMWQGEDRHFCVRATRANVGLWADAWPDIWHCYRPSMRQQLDAWALALQQESKKRPIVNITLTPMEEPKVAGYVGHFRGPLESLGLVDDLKRVVGDMEPGDVVVEDALMPLWHPIAGYGGKRRLIQVECVDRKTDELAPVVSEVAPNSGLLLSKIFAAYAEKEAA